MQPKFQLIILTIFLFGWIWRNADTNLFVCRQIIWKIFFKSKRQSNPPIEVYLGRVLCDSLTGEPVLFFDMVTETIGVG